jgi:type II secretory pathway pseudopilin PulG
MTRAPQRRAIRAPQRRATRAPQPRATRAFTLMELLVVVGLIAALSLVVLSALNTSRGSALQAGQGTMANLLVAARSKAAATNQSVRLLVNFNPTSTDQPSRYLRYVVLQVQSGTAWQSVTDAYLPDGVFVIPGNVAIPTGLFASTDNAWTKTDGSDLRSTTLRNNNSVTDAINGSTTELWLCLPIAATGTTSASGDLVLAAGRARPPGSFAPGESPVELVNPEEVRGLTVSQYGVAMLINSRSSF